jgi:hypothetical protein
MIAGAETSDIGRSRGDTCQVGRAAEMTRYSAPPAGRGVWGYSTIRRRGGSFRDACHQERVSAAGHGNFSARSRTLTIRRTAGRSGRIELRGQTAVLRLDGLEVDAAAFEDLTRLYRLIVGDDVTATDEECWVARFGERVWVLPHAIPGVINWLFDAWYARLCASRLFFEAYLVALPPAWRKRLFGVLPIPVPRPGCFPASTLPPWREVGPLNFSELPKPTG